ncbi:MmyB family transcriptional regulator [Kineosporia babensis]|uniref:MmyB family transcriptional regulator n=1 Tax=Kineosporia babensis TaxID=499548 RepID=UPI0038B3A830
MNDRIARSDKFHELWETHKVESLTSTAKRIRHPEAGELALQCDVVLCLATGRWLVGFRSRPGSGAGKWLSILSVLGEQRFDFRGRFAVPAVSRGRTWPRRCRRVGVRR